MGTRRRWTLNDKVFTDNYLIACVICLSETGASVIDGIVVSRMLGGDARAY